DLRECELLIPREAVSQILCQVIGGTAELGIMNPVRAALETLQPVWTNLEPGSIRQRNLEINLRTHPATQRLRQVVFDQAFMFLPGLRYCVDEGLRRRFCRHLRQRPRRPGFGFHSNRTRHGIIERLESSARQDSLGEAYQSSHSPDSQFCA